MPSIPGSGATGARRLLPVQLEPVEAVGPEGHAVGATAHGRERYPAQELDGTAVGPPGQVELGGLGEAAQVVHAQHGIVAASVRPARPDRRTPGPAAAGPRPPGSASGWGLRT